MTLATIFRFLLRDVPRAVIGVIILIAIAVNFANIVGRYVFLAPLPWAEEVLIFLVVWGVFVGSIAVSYDKRHLVMDLFVRLFPSWLRGTLEVVTLIMLVGFCGFVCVQAWTIVSLMWRISQVSITAGIPMTIPYSAFLVGFGLIAVGAAAGAYVRWQATRAGEPNV